MADVIDYGQVKNAAKDATNEVVQNDLRSMQQQLNQQGAQINDMQNRLGPINNLEQRLSTLELKIDQLTNQMQNILARLP